MSPTSIHPELAFRPHRATTAVSPTLFGLFLEDINFACDGGLNANLVNNHSFGGVYAIPGTVPYLPLDLVPEEHRERLANTPPDQLQLPSTTPAGRQTDPLRHWIIRGGSLEATSEDPFVPGAGYARVTTTGIAELRNDGYPGEAPGMSFVAGLPLEFSALVRADRFTGSVAVRLLGADGGTIAEQPLALSGSGWQQIGLALVPSATVLGSLQIVLRGQGALDLDEIRLIASDHWGAGDPRWSQGTLRRDLVEALQALAPRFLRFPGGCIVEGCGQGSHYKWKDTVGPLVTRRPEYSLWGQSRPGGDYSQSNQVGFYEFFLLCEDLGMEPVPVVWSGDSCQTRMDEHLDIDGPEFAEVVQDALDLVEWATGDPATSRWAALRAEAGHPAPFPLRYLGIGNENFGPAYLAHFAAIKDALDEVRPDLELIVTGGVVPIGESRDPAWAAWGHEKRILVDEHFYNPPSWFFDSAERYATYPRGGARVFLGEYAAHTMYPLPDSHPAIPESLAVQEPNTWLSALAEAAFLTGVERNSDIVAFSCYAPLLNLVENGQWEHDLIDFSPSHVVATANYLVQQVFGTRIGDRIVPVEGEPADGVFVSATTTEDVLHIKLVNINATPVELPLRLEGAAEGGAEAVLLHGPLGAVNRLSFEGLPRYEIEPQAATVTVRDGGAVVPLPAGSLLAVSVGLD